MSTLSCVRYLSKIKLARQELAPLAEKQGLRLSFSSESSVEAEIARESGADAPTVLLSYALMCVP